MKFGIRVPSLTKRVAARTSLKRFARHSLGLKAPRGFGWFTNPRRALYNRVYNRTTIKADGLIVGGIFLLFGVFVGLVTALVSAFSGRSSSALAGSDLPLCPRCRSSLILRSGPRGEFYGCSRFPHCRGTRDYVSALPPS